MWVPHHKASAALAVLLAKVPHVLLWLKRLANVEPHPLLKSSEESIDLPLVACSTRVVHVDEQQQLLPILQRGLCL